MIIKDWTFLFLESPIQRRSARAIHGDTFLEVPFGLGRSIVGNYSTLLLIDLHLFRSVGFLIYYFRYLACYLFYFAELDLL